MKNITKIMCGIVIAATMAMTCVACTNDKNVNDENSTIATESSETEVDTETTEETTEETETTEDTTETTEDTTETNEETTEPETNEETIVGPTSIATTIAKKPAPTTIKKEDNVIHNQATEPQEDRDMGSQEEEVIVEEQKMDNSVGVSDSDYILLCNAVAHEAGSNWISTSEKAKVAEVILNRVNSGSYPDTVYGVLTQRGQFSGASSYVNLGTYSGKVSDDVKAAVDMALDSSYDNHGYTGFWGDGSQNHFH